MADSSRIRSDWGASKKANPGFGAQPDKDIDQCARRARAVLTSQSTLHLCGRTSAARRIVQPPIKAARTGSKVKNRKNHAFARVQEAHRGPRPSTGADPRSDVGIAGELAGDIRDDGRRRGYQGENAAPAKATNWLEIPPAGNYPAGGVCPSKRERNAHFIRVTEQALAFARSPVLPSSGMPGSRSGRTWKRPCLCAISGWCSNSLARYMGAFWQARCPPRPSARDWPGARDNGARRHRSNSAARGFRTPSGSPRKRS